ncbi:hypothetical protein BDR05DRAFT_946535 [Suillus weaverae]|nr:hypothetical protein BDR05DRAFT_946535 [Suillus weaverae]
MPSMARALFELTRLHWFPVGCDFMFWPFAWGFLSAAYHVALPMSHVVKNILFYYTGCVINDILDRDFDRKVERSKGRPIASGAITRTDTSILLAALITAIFYMFSTAGSIAFTLSVVGLPDKKDDEKAGVKSMAVRLCAGIRPVLSLFDVAFVVCLLFAGYLNSQRLPFYVISVIALFLLCLWHIWSFDHNDPKDRWKKFTAGRHGAAMVCAGLVVDHYFKLASLTV